MIRINGAHGEGGGQVLRTALALSLATGQPFSIAGIRAGRNKPGLLRQHLAAVHAARDISDATVDGDALGSTRLAFRPGRVRAGDYAFAVGSAGSAALVFQTVFPALALADAPSTLTLEGGTHNPAAPPFDFLDRVFAPAMRRMGAGLDLSLERHGFYPAGGGRFTARITPAAAGRLTPPTWMERGAPLRRRATILLSDIHADIARRERETLRRAGWAEADIDLREVESPGPGNAVMLEGEYERATELVTEFGRRGVSSEKVAHRAEESWRRYARASAPVGEHLADQLLVPLALAGGGAFCTLPPTSHTRTNAETITAFLPARFSFHERAADDWEIALA